MTTSSYESLSHSKWDCKYHLVFIPKCRKKGLYGKIREYLGSLFHELAAQRNGKILEGRMVQGHVHMPISIPPKYPVAEVVGCLKGKSAVSVARQFSGRQCNGQYKPDTFLDSLPIKIPLKLQRGLITYF